MRKIFEKKRKIIKQSLKIIMVIFLNNPDQELRRKHFPLRSSVLQSSLTVVPPDRLKPLFATGERPEEDCGRERQDPPSVQPLL